MQVRFAAVEVDAMTGTASPSWKPRAEARKASAAATVATGSQGESASASRPSPAAPVSAFSATSPTPNSTPAAAPRIAPWWWAGAPMLRGGDQQRADGERDGLEDDQAGDGERGVMAVGRRHGEDEQHEPGRGHRDARPLAAADAVAEDPVAEHGEHHDAGGEHDLDRRERGERERGDVQDPRAGGDRHADREPASTRTATARWPAAAAARRAARTRRRGACTGSPAA